MSDTAFDMLLECLKEAFPPGETLPCSYYEAKKLRKALGFSYVKYDACPKDCMLFWKDKNGLDNCEKCQRSRYKETTLSSHDRTARVTRTPIKQVRHFPIKPWLQRLFMTLETTQLMRWHAEERSDDGISRHPADAPAWKAFNEKYPTFGSDSRNIRL